MGQNGPISAQISLWLAPQFRGRAPAPPMRQGLAPTTPTDVTIQQGPGGGAKVTSRVKREGRATRHYGLWKILGQRGIKPWRINNKHERLPSRGRLPFAITAPKRVAV